jgi:glycine/D-amino acid oxidase-like deaminating enzyme
MARSVIIVGGGIVGCSAAYFLAREGAQVTLLEAEEVAYGASGRNPGFVWLHLRSPGFATAASKGSRRLYDEFAAELDDFEFRPAGGILFFTTPEQGRFLREYHAFRSADGLDLALIDAGEVRTLVPPIRQDVLGASYCPHDAYINTPKLVEALATGARRHGAQVREHEPALELVEGGVRTAAGVVSADAVVVAAGVWSAALLAPRGIVLPVGAERLHVVGLEPTTDRIEPLVYAPSAVPKYEMLRNLPGYNPADWIAPHEDPRVDLVPVLSQRADGTILLGCASDYPKTLDARPTVEAVALTLRSMQADFPGLRTASISRAWAGLLPYTPDTLPVIEEVRPGLFVAAGHVYGNSAGPMTGKLLTQLVLGEEPEIDLAACRFDRGLPVPQLGVAQAW